MEISTVLLASTVCRLFILLLPVYHIWQSSCLFLGKMVYLRRRATDPFFEFARSPTDVGIERLRPLYKSMF